MSKKAEQLKARFGGHMNESMNAGRSAAAAGGEASNQTKPTAATGSQGTVSGSQEGVTRFREASRIAVERIMADPSQPRTEFPDDELNRLAASLKTRGQLQPIRVRWSNSHDKYIILAGERRWRAAKLAKIAVMECVVENRDLTPEEVLQDQVVENCLREDLRPIEQARAFRRLMDAKGWSLRQIGQELHLAHATVVKALALLELPEAVQELVEQGTVKPATAYEIGKAETREQQIALAERVVNEGLTRDQVTSAVKEKKERKAAPAAPPAPAKPSREEIVLPDGSRVVVTGPAVEGGVASIAEALAEAREILLAKDQGSSRGHAA